MNDNDRLVEAINQIEKVIKELIDEMRKDRLERLRERDL